MNLNEIVRQYSEEIDGQYMEYDGEHSIIIVPVSGGRAQTVLGTIRKNELYNRTLVCFSSKVCAYTPEIDLRHLLEQAAYFNYCRFVLREDNLQVEAVGSAEGITKDALKEMIQEVANLADQFELKLTGVDVN